MRKSCYEGAKTEIRNRPNKQWSHISLHKDTRNQGKDGIPMTVF